MPDRMLRAAMIGSEKLAQVDDQSALLYDRLLVIADDFGLVDMSPVSLMMRAVPGRQTYTAQVVERCVGQLVKVGLVRDYKQDGKRYGAITRWNQTRWAQKPKHPMPPWGEEHIEGGHVARRARDPQLKPDSPVGKPRGNGADHDAGFDAFAAAYPRREAIAAARKAWQKLAPDSGLQRAIIEAIEAQRRSGCLQDKRIDGRSLIPLPASWLNGRRWEDKPGPARDTGMNPDLVI